MKTLSFSESQAQKLYDSGLNDKQIAESLNIPWYEITRWREVKGLVSNHWKKKRGKVHEISL